MTPHGLSCRRSSRSACGWSSQRGGCAVPEVLAAVLSVVITLAAVAVIVGLLALANKADQFILSEIRKQDTDRNL